MNEHAFDLGLCMALILILTVAVNVSAKKGRGIRLLISIVALFVVAILFWAELLEVIA